MFITESQKPAIDGYSEPTESSRDPCILIFNDMHSVVEIIPQYQWKMEANPYFHIPFFFRV
jgi:hypothetical protein